jgi:hypothetical protein
MAKYEEFTVDQGSDVAIEVHLADIYGNPKDLSAYSAQAKLKKNYNSDSSDTLDFLCIVAQPSTDGIVTLSLTNAQTDALRPGRYLYDVEIYFNDSDGILVVERVLEGRVQVTPSVTR